MKEIIQGKLYDTEKSELLYTIEFEITNLGITTKKIEKLYRTNKAKKFFICILEFEKDPMRPITQQVQDNDGWELFEVSDDSARIWTEKFLPTNEIVKIFDVEEM